jgi:hypothetical protein
MYVCIANHVCEMYVCKYNKSNIWGVCMYIKMKMQFTNLY